MESKEREREMTTKQGTSKLAKVLDADTTLLWLRMLAMNIFTLKALEKYCEWLHEQVLNADREVTLWAWQTNFDFFMAFRNSPICLCMAASIGTKAYIERKAIKQMGNGGIARSDEGKLIRIWLKEPNTKLEEFAENPCLLPKEGLLTLRD
jgi:hypothetical protein